MDREERAAARGAGEREAARARAVGNRREEDGLQVEEEQRRRALLRKVPRERDKDFAAVSAPAAPRRRSGGSLARETAALGGKSVAALGREARRGPTQRLSAVSPALPTAPSSSGEATPQRLWPEMCSARRRYILCLCLVLHHQHPILPAQQQYVSAISPQLRPRRRDARPVQLAGRRQHWHRSSGCCRCSRRLLLRLLRLEEEEAKGEPPSPCARRRGGGGARPSFPGAGR